MQFGPLRANLQGSDTSTQPQPQNEQSQQQASAEVGDSDAAAAADKLRGAVKTKHDTKKRRLRKKLNAELPSEGELLEAQAQVKERIRLSREDLRRAGTSLADDSGPAADADGAAPSSPTSAPTETAAAASGQAQSAAAAAPSGKPMTAKALRRQKLEEEQRQQAERQREQAEEAQMYSAAHSKLNREDRTTRFDIATAQLESGMDDAELLTYRASRLPTLVAKELMRTRKEQSVKLAKMSWEALREKKDLTEDEQVSFFSNTIWELDELTAAADDGTIATAAAAAAAGTELAAQADDEIYVYEGEKVYLHRAVFPPMADESKLYYYPSAASVPPVSVEHPVDLADEGLYVGRRPRVTEGNVLRLQSILTMKADVYASKKDWLGDDGRLRMLPDPLKDVPMRPLVPDEDDDIRVGQQPALRQLSHCEYRPARRWDSPFASLERETPWQLEVDIGGVQFLEHPLFTREHAAVSRLRQLHGRYSRTEKSNFPAYFRDRIAALRREIAKLAQETARMDRSQNCNEMVLQDYRARLDAYRAELATTRHSKILEEAAHYTLLIDLLNAWRDVRDVRQEAGFSVTDVRCDIEETVQSRSEDEQELLAEIRDWAEEQQAAAQSKHQLLQAEYLAQRQQYERRRADYEGRRLAMEQSGMATSEFDEEPPIEPQAENLDNFVQQIERLVRLGEDEQGQVTCRRRQPGEPLVRVRLLDNSHVPTPLSDIPAQHRAAEELRRRRMESELFYTVQIYADEKLVGPSETVTLSSSFALHFNRIYLVEVVQPPSRIRLHLTETRRGGFRAATRTIGTAALPRPDSQTTRAQVNFSEVRFSQRGQTQGQGDNYKGILRARCGWRADAEGNILAPMLKVYDPQTETYVDAAPDAPVLPRLTEMRDPNDPAFVRLNYNAPLGQDQQQQQQQQLASGYCRLNFFEEEFGFCSSEDLDADLRFRALIMRDRGEIGPEQLKGECIPPFASLISKEMVEEPKREAEISRTRASELQKMRLRYEVKMRYVREQVNEAFNAAKGYRTYEEVIDEAKAVVVDVLSLLRPLFTRKRPLKPAREVVSRTPLLSLAMAPITLSVNIIDAVDLPMPNDSKQLLRPFVEVTFQGNTLRTATMSGTNPDWNASLELPFRLRNAAQKPETISDPLLLKVFNDRTYSRPAEGQQATDVGSVVVQEKHFLGSVSIPFSTIYINEKVQGRLQLRVPDLVAGYGGSEDGSAAGRRRARAPAVRVFITLQPHLARPGLLQQAFDTVHEPARHWVRATKHSLARLADEVAATMRQMQSDPEAQPEEFLYHPRAFVVNMEVKEVFVSCYLSSNGLAPPEELFIRGQEVTNLDHKKLIVASYVSLVPFVSDASAFPGLIDIWNTCEEFMDYQAGDEEEHAVLLANYLAHLNQGSGTQIYLVLGNAVPEGSTAYVVEIDGNDKYVWNPSLGLRFNALGDRCPLISVDSLICASGVYVNKKPYEGIRVLNYSVTDQNYWLHIEKPNERTFECIQQPISYSGSAVTESDMANIEYEIEITLRKAISEWRPRVPTLWYNAGTREIRDLLKYMEIYHFNPEASQLLAAKESYNKQFASKIIVGYSLRLGYMSTDEILQEVRNTKLHEIGMYVDSSDVVPKVQFSCVVHLHKYPKGVLAIRLNLMALNRR